MVWGQAQEWREQRSQVVMSEPLRQKPKGDQGIEQGLHARVSEAQCRRALAAHVDGLIDLLKGVVA